MMIPNNGLLFWATLYILCSPNTGVEFELWTV